MGDQPSNGLEGKSGEGVRKARIERKSAGKSMSMSSYSSTESRRENVSTAVGTTGSSGG